MPWNENSALRLQEMYDQVYSHLINTSEHRETILQILGQCLFSEGIDSDVDNTSGPANTSPNRIEKLLGLENCTIPQLLADISLLVQAGNADQDIEIKNSFRSFLLDRSRSQGLFLDLDGARLTLRFAAPIRKVFGAKGMQMKFSIEADDLCLISFFLCIPWAANAMAYEFVVATPRYVRPGVFLSDSRLATPGDHPPNSRPVLVLQRHGL